MSPPIIFHVYLFSEEVGRLYAGESGKRSHEGICNGMVVDRVKPNVLHVLTSFPLELHSYYPVSESLILITDCSQTGENEFFSGIGEGKYVRRLLVDPEM